MSPGEKDHTKSPMRHQQPSRWKNCTKAAQPRTREERGEELGAGVPGTDRPPQDQTQPSQEQQPHDDTEAGEPATDPLWQIPQAQGWIQKKGETTTTGQTWTSHESGGNTKRKHERVAGWPGKASPELTMQEKKGQRNKLSYKLRYHRKK